jgi:NAD(P)-dependent dehydrogenase (short-subunit alcohol dehydrogenase family)
MEFSAMSVLITGCASGFGRLTALALARSGSRVFATVRNPDSSAELAITAEREELPLTIHRLDVTDPESVAHAVGEITAQSEVDVLINNAGQRGPRGPVTTFSDQEVTAVLDVNLLGPIRMVRAVVPSMIAAGRGTIVNVSSMAGMVGVPFESGYCISKHALEAMSEALRWELDGTGVRVHLVQPGAYDTNFFGPEIEPAAFVGKHPQRTAFDRYTEAINRTMVTGLLKDPQQVANVICSAVTDPEAPFRQIVGSDAEQIIALKRQRPYEEYEATLRGLFGLDVDQADAGVSG